MKVPWTAEGDIEVSDHKFSRTQTALRRTLKDDGRIRSDQDGAGTGTTGRARGPLGVDSDVTAEDDGVPAVPGRALDPVDGVEERGGPAVAGVLRVDALDVGVAVRLEEVHEDRLDRLGLVDDGLGADIEATDREGVDAVLLEQARDG